MRVMVASADHCAPAESKDIVQSTSWEELSQTSSRTRNQGTWLVEAERKGAEPGQHNHTGNKVHPEVNEISNGFDGHTTLHTGVLGTARSRRPSLNVPLQQTIRNHDISWKKNRDAIDQRIFRWALLSAFSGLGGTISTIIQNEIVFQDGDPEDWVFAFLKTLNTLCTVVCLVCVCEMSKLRILFDRVTKFIHCNRHLDTHVSIWDAMGGTALSLEILIILPHLPPFVTFEIPTKNMSNFVLYRAETVFCCYSTLRVYLLWRIIKYLVLSPYPKRHTVSMYTTANLNSAFAVKILFDGWYAALSVSIFWGAFVLLFGYWFRAVETTACLFESSKHTECQSPEAITWIENGGEGFRFTKSNDLYLANACWAVFGTSTALGYGNIYPITHGGRFVAGLAALAGTILLSLFTASLGIGLIPTQIQHTAMALLERERCRDELLKWAGQFIGSWLRLRKNPDDKRAQRQFYLMRKQYGHVKSMAQSDITEFAAESVKVNQVVAQLNLISHRLRQVECTEVVGLKGPDDSQEREQRRGSKGASSPYSAWPGRGVLKVPLRNQSDSVDSWEGGKKPKWRTSRVNLETQEIVAGNWAAACATFAVILSVVSNELVYQGIDPYSGWVDLCKVLTTLASLGSLIFLHRLYHAQSLLRCLLAHVVGRRIPPQFALRRGGNMGFWIEALVCAPFLPPQCSSEFGFEQMGNFVCYRAETIFCLFASLRLYLLVRVWKNRILSDLPRKHTVEELLKIKIGYSFAMKRVFSSSNQVFSASNAMRSLCVLWACGSLMLSWWLRAAERTSCSLPSATHPRCSSPEATEWTLYGSPVDTTHLVYFQNAAWMVWVSATTVGFTTIYPVTHVGRIVIAISTVLGMVMAALLTATLWTALSRTVTEEAALNLLKKFRVKKELDYHSVSLIQLWWRRRRKKPVTWRHRFLTLERAVDNMIRSQREERVGRETVKNTSSHLDDITQESRDLLRRMEELLARLGEVGPNPKPPPSEQGTAFAQAQIPIENTSLEPGMDNVEVFGETGGGKDAQDGEERAIRGGVSEAAEEESGGAQGSGGRPMYTGWVGLGNGPGEGAAGSSPQNLTGTEILDDI